MPNPPKPTPPGARARSNVQAQTRAMFTRVLSGWALDLLALRRSGLIVPSHRPGTPDLVTPDFGDSLPGRDDGPRWAGTDVASALRWRPNRRAA